MKESENSRSEVKNDILESPGIYHERARFESLSTLSPNPMIIISIIMMNMPGPRTKKNEQDTIKSFKDQTCAGVVRVRSFIHLQIDSLPIHPAPSQFARGLNNLHPSFFIHSCSISYLEEIQFLIFQSLQCNHKLKPSYA